MLQPQKKKKPSLTLIFTIVVAGLAAYIYFVEIKKHAADAEHKDKDSVIFQYQVDRINHIDLKNLHDFVQLEKKDGHWQMLQPWADAADDTEVGLFLTQATQEKSVDTVVEAADINWSTYGLDKPVQDLTLKTTDKASQEMRVGSVKAFDNNLYARVGEQGKVLLIKSSWTSQLDKPAKSFRRSLLLSNQSETFSRVEILPGPSVDLIKSKDKDGKDIWSFTKASKVPVKISMDQLSKFAESIKALKASDFVSETQSPQDLKKYGLSSPSLIIRMQPEAPAASKDPAKPAAPEAKVWELKISAAKPTDTSVYAVSSDTKGIVQIPKAQADALRKKPEDFYDRSAPFEYSVNDAASVQVQTPGFSLEAKKQGPEWVSADTGSKQKIDPVRFQQLLDGISHLEAHQFMPLSSAKGLDHAKNRISIYNQKGERLLELKMGDSFTDTKAESNLPVPSRKKNQAPKAPMRYYFVSTQKSDQALAVSAEAIDGLPIKNLFIVTPPPSTTTTLAPVPPPKGK